MGTQPSAPSIVGVSPSDQSTDIVLGTQIVVAFDQVMDTTTINAQTFSVSGPGIAEILTPNASTLRDPQLVKGRSLIFGTFSFSTNTAGNTVATFTPSRPLAPNVTYTVLVIGPSSALSATVKSSAEIALDSNYQWSFTTGDLDISQPPPISPLPPLVLPLDPSCVKVENKIWPVGNDLSQVITLTFPANIDTTSVTAADILLSLEPLLNDPMIRVPSGLTPTVVIADNTITITITGWPADEQVPDWADPWF